MIAGGAVLGPPGWGGAYKGTKVPCLAAHDIHAPLEKGSTKAATTLSAMGAFVSRSSKFSRKRRKRGPLRRSPSESPATSEVKYTGRDVIGRRLWKRKAWW